MSGLYSTCQPWLMTAPQPLVPTVPCSSSTAAARTGVGSRASGRPFSPRLFREQGEEAPTLCHPLSHCHPWQCPRPPAGDGGGEQSILCLERSHVVAVVAVGGLPLSLSNSSWPLQAWQGEGSLSPGGALGRGGVLAWGSFLFGPWLPAHP